MLNLGDQVTHPDLLPENGHRGKFFITGIVMARLRSEVPGVPGSVGLCRSYIVNLDLDNPIPADDRRLKRVSVTVFNHDKDYRYMVKHGVAETTQEKKLRVARKRAAHKHDKESKV